MSDSLGLVRCLRCRSTLDRSGKEPHRLVCSACGQHFLVVLQLVPVDAPKEPLLLEDIDAQ